MKIKISFELDVSDTSYDIKEESDILEVLQNVTTLLHELETMKLENICEIMANKESSKEVKDYLIAHYKEDRQILSTMFHNFEMSGKLVNGKSFKFTHTEPGYKEDLTIHD